MPSAITLAELEQYLAKAADLSRGSIDQADFRAYIFPLMFFKRISDVYAEEYAAALDESGGDAEYAAFAENHRFAIPKDCGWADVRERTENIGTALQTAFREIEKANPETLYGIPGSMRSGLVTLVQRGLASYAYESGLVAKAEEEIKVDARRALGSMTPLERDVYGFTTRNAKRLQLAEPYLMDVRANRRRIVVYWMSRLEQEESGLARESRYATAIRRLLAMGETRAAISRTLGISTSVMDRIQRENRRDVVLAQTDPIVTDLAPSLR